MDFVFNLNKFLERIPLRFVLDSTLSCFSSGFVLDLLYVTLLQNQITNVILVLKDSETASKKLNSFVLN